MDGKSILTSAAIGLAGLLGGCDNNAVRVVDTCTKGDITFKAVYHEVPLRGDFLSVDIYRQNTFIATVSTGDSRDDDHYTLIPCDDGTELRVGGMAFGPGEFYRTSSTQR